MKKLLMLISLAVVAAMADDAKVTPLMNKDISAIAPKGATMLTVEYPPGGSSAEHRHNAHTFVYVLEGSLVMAVKGGKEVTLGPGKMALRFAIERRVNLPARGWFAADVRCHELSPHAALLEGAAEGLALQI